MQITREEAYWKLVEHYIEIETGCEFGNHWWCSCGESGLGETTQHILDILFGKEVS